MPTATRCSRCLAMLVVCSLSAAPLVAQSAVKPSFVGEKGWQFKPTFLIEGEYDNNIFLLPDLKKGNLIAGAPAGTRFADMESASDVITTLNAQFAFEGTGIGGRNMKIVPELGYDFYSRNAERRSATYRISLAQKTGHGGLFRLKAAMQPQTFFKNYLVDAIDRDGNGTITSAEKLYAPARQGENTIDVEYTLRFRKQSAQTAIGTAVRLDGGWYSRTYNAAFTSRDLKGPTAGVKLLLNTTAHSHVDLGYDVASLTAPRMLNVVLLDETQFNRDFNGNGSTSDVNARAVQMVDHSRTEHEVSAAFGTDFGATDLELDLVHRIRRFRSTEPYDVANNGRRDARNEVGGTLRHDIGRGLRLRIAAQHGAQTLNRANAVATTGDVADYTRLRTSAGLEYRF